MQEGSLSGSVQRTREREGCKIGKEERAGTLLTRGVRSRSRNVRSARLRRPQQGDASTWEDGDVTQRRAPVGRERGCGGRERCEDGTGDARERRKEAP